jgi:hypothetical protein
MKTQQRKKKEKAPQEKSGYEITDEELPAHVKKEVRDHFKPKKLEPKEPVDPAGKKFYLSEMCQPK